MSSKANPYSNTPDAQPPPSGKKSPFPPAVPMEKRASNPYSNVADAMPVLPKDQLRPPSQPRGSALAGFMKPDLIPNAFITITYAKKSSVLNCCLCCDGQPAKREAFQISVNGECRTDRPGFSRITQGGVLKLEVPGKVEFQLEAVDNLVSTSKSFGPFDPKLTHFITLKWIREKDGKWNPDLFLEEE